MRDASICGLGQAASAAIESALRAGLVEFAATSSPGFAAAGGPVDDGDAKPGDAAAAGNAGAGAGGPA